MSRASDPIVTSSAFRETVTHDGRRYLIRPPSFGEAGELAARVMGALRPGPALIAEAIRQALEETLGEAAAPHVAAISAHEQADDHLQAVLISRPLGSEPPSVHAEWRGQLMDANKSLAGADRARQRAAARVAEHPEVLRANAGALEAQFADRLHTVHVCLCGWEGEGLPAWSPGDDGRIPLELLRTLPAGDMATLGERCAALTRPSKAAEKN